MEVNSHIRQATLAFCGTFFLIALCARAQSSYDSLRLKLPKHYFNTIIAFDFYGKPNVKLDTNDGIGKRLKSYGVKQFNLSFNIPLITREWKGNGADSNVIANTHLLLTGNFVSLQPVFDGIPNHRLTKRGIGVRYIFNTGKKAVWFFDAAPFVTRDVTYRSDPYFRLASTIIFSYNVSDKFNFRLGATKSFMWGNRLYLPFLGLRIGRLDKVNLSIQLPRSISLNIPFNDNFILSVYTRPQGGLYNFSNRDSLYRDPPSRRVKTNTFHFTRYEINTGLRFDVRIGSAFSFFFCGGISSRNNITFYSNNANKSRTVSPYNRYFFADKPLSTLYAQFGLVLKLGKTRSISNNRNLYDAINLNSQETNADNNRQIPIQRKKKLKNPNLDAVQDLIDYHDF